MTSLRTSGPVGIIALILAVTIFAIPAFGDWAEDALALQEFLDTTNTFNMTTWVGGHNAYANDDWGYFDPNQKHKPKELLYAGARQMEYDPRKDDSGDLRLCHGDCSFWGGEKTFTEGLEQIKTFIKSYPNSVVFLKLEMDNALSKTSDKLESKLENFIYKPTEGFISTGSECPGRYGLEPEYLTKADILAAGKNVIVFAGNGAMDECPGSSSFMEWVHVGLEYEGDGWQLKFDSPDSPSESGALYEQGRMTLVHDPNTYININGGGADQVFTPSNVANYMKKGHNVFELFNFNGDDTVMFDDVMAKDMVWSWNTHEPAGDGDCAVVNDTVGSLFNDTSCDYSLRFACFDEGTDVWSVTSGSGTWEDGAQTCSSELGEASLFYVPTNPRQMADLQDTLNAAGITSAVYVNYHDLSIEGVWQANNPTQLTVTSTSTVGDTTEGSAIDFRYMIDRGLYTENLLQVTSTRIRAKDRIKGVELTYSDGTELYYGGGDGSFSSSLDLSGSTAVTTIEVCIDRYNGEDRVFYLELTTNTGSSISNGSREGDCTTLALSGDLMGFFGTAGDSYFNSIGFYTTEVAFSDDTSGWNVINLPIDDFADWTAAPGAMVVSGDFNGDGMDDIATTGVDGWASLPIAFSQGDGTFVVSNQPIDSFADWTTAAGAMVVSGDFNGDGMDDLAVTGVDGWSTVPIAFSRSDGTFSVSNQPIDSFADWTAASGAMVVSGDFDGDGMDDLAVTGVDGWTSLPIAFSLGNGTFQVSNHAIDSFAGWTAAPGAKVVGGDFDGDGRDDLAVTGGSGWASQPTAFSRGDGTFLVTNAALADFPTWASDSSATLVGGDFDGDGWSDFALTGVESWSTLPLATSLGNGGFSASNGQIASFAQWTAMTGAKVVGGDFNGDGKDDLAVTGVAGWASLPVAMSIQP